jgi:hypothetical protein
MTALLLLSLSAFAQSKPEKAVGNSLIEAQPALIPMASINPPSVSWSDKITKEGHYVATMDDPNNEYRCDITSYVEENPHNAYGSAVSSFTVVCTKKREPEHDK